MSERFNPIRLKHAAALLAAGVLLIACSLPVSLPGAGAPETGTATPTPTLKFAPNGPGAPTSQPLAECPEVDTQASLTFDHNVEWGLEGAGKFGVAVKGAYQVNIIKSDTAEKPGTMAGIYNLNTGPFPATVTANGFKDCSDGQSETAMFAVVTGTCIHGVLTLNIVESYDPTSVTILCNENKDKVDIPVPISSLFAPVTWTIPISQLSAGGAEKQVPFMGVGGSGAFMYTLTLP
jgi:hypothetical protein